MNIAPEFVTEHGDTTAPDTEILRTVVGSGVHGIAVEGTDDHDEMGVYVEPLATVLNRDAGRHYVARTQPEGARSGPGDTDLVLYSLRKYLRLATQGNPTVLIPLYAQGADVLISTPLGDRLRGSRYLFATREAGRRFLGYLDGQLERVQGRGQRRRIPNRPELIAAYGYDTKYASHALRLAYQGVELMTTGHLMLPMRDKARRHVYDVKTGVYTYDDALAAIRHQRDVLAALIDTSSYGGATCTLPDQPDREAITALSVELHTASWGSVQAP